MSPSPQVVHSLLVFLLAACLLTWPHQSHARTLPAVDSIAVRLKNFKQAALWTYVWGQPLASVYDLQVGKCEGKLNTLKYDTNISAYLNIGPFCPLIGLNTIYGGACLDVMNEPVMVQMPFVGNRYYSVMVLNAYGDFVSVNGSRTHPQGPLNITYYNPQALPSQVLEEIPASERVALPTSDNLLVIRISVFNVSDVPNVVDLLSQIKIVPLSEAVQPGSKARTVPDLPELSGQPEPIQRMIVIDRFVRRNPPPPERPGTLLAIRQLAMLGIHPNMSSPPFDPASLPPVKRQLLITAGNAAKKAIATLGLAGGVGQLFGRGSQRRHQWLTSRDPTRESFRFLASAFYASHGFNFVNPPEEATYFLSVVDSSLSTYHGSKSYVLRLQPPKVMAFWSLALYDAVGNFPQSLVKHQVGSFDSGLKVEEDGIVTIFISPEPPSQSDTTNWIPTPNSTFILLLRAYNPLDAKYFPDSVDMCKNADCTRSVIV